MQIFISWSGEKSKKIAEVIRYWLPDVIQSVRPYFTPDDVTKGQRWETDIAENLHKSRFGLFCLTAENLTAPWLLFEAGAVSKDNRAGRVCPLLFGIDSAQLKGPLVQFQATPFSQAEMLKFMKAVNEATSEPLSEIHLARAFDRCWHELDERIQAILCSNLEDETPPPRSVEEMVEETLGIVRSMSQNPISSAGDDPRGHWLVLCQSTLEYARDALKIAENAEQSAMLEQLKRLSDYLKMVANLMAPKLKGTKVGPTYLAEITKVHKEIGHRIAELAQVLGDDEL